MTRPLSNNLRERVVAALAGGASCRAVAARFGRTYAGSLNWSSDRLQAGRRVLRSHRGASVLLHQPSSFQWSGRQRTA